VHISPDTLVVLHFYPSEVLWSCRNMSGWQTYEHFQKQCWASYLHVKN